MKKPNGDLNQLLRTLDSGARFTVNDVRTEARIENPSETVLDSADEKLLSRFIGYIRSGRPSVIITEDGAATEWLTMRAEKITVIKMMGSVTERLAKDLGAE